MAKKEFVIFGLGRFGKSVALTLAESGCEVLVVDDNEEAIHEMADFVTYAVKADVTDPDALSTLGISNFDGAIVGIGTDLEASVMVTILAKELGIPYVLAKAKTELHAKILKRVGADAVVFPEKETGVRIAHNLLLGNFFDAVELSSTYSMMELDLLNEWDGKSLLQLGLRAKYKINVIGIKRGNELDINPAPDKILKNNDVLIVIGENDMLNKLIQNK